MAAFIDSDDNFMVYRRFGYVQSRILLARQEKLRRLEARLEALDEEQVAESKEPDLLCKARVGGKMEVDRESLMLEIEREFMQYSMFNAWTCGISLTFCLSRFPAKGAGDGGAEQAQLE